MEIKYFGRRKRYFYFTVDIPWYIYTIIAQNSVRTHEVKLVVRYDMIGI